MLATEKFTLRISPEDRELLARLSKMVHRSQSDTIRWIVRETAKAFETEGFSGQKVKRTPKQKPI
jgi:hypothetical protein